MIDVEAGIITPRSPKMHLDKAPENHLTLPDRRASGGRPRGDEALFTESLRRDTSQARFAGRANADTIFHRAIIIARRLSRRPGRQASPEFPASTVQDNRSAMLSAAARDASPPSSLRRRTSSPDAPILSGR